MDITDFADPEEQSLWYALNDPVMGGRSSGGPSFQDGVLVFSGRTDTNGGGFASIRRPIPEGSLRDATGVRLRVRGDGRAYEVLFQTGEHRGPSPVGFRAGFRAGFDAPAASGDHGSEQPDGHPDGHQDGHSDGHPDWHEARVIFDALTASVRGRSVPDARFDPARATLIGFFIYDRIDGPFRLEVGAISALTGGDGTLAN